MLIAGHLKACHQPSIIQLISQNLFYLGRKETNCRTQDSFFSRIFESLIKMDQRSMTYRKTPFCQHLDLKSDQVQVKDTFRLVPLMHFFLLVLICQAHLRVLCRTVHQFLSHFHFKVWLGSLDFIFIEYFSSFDTDYDLSNYIYQKGLTKRTFLIKAIRFLFISCR